MFDNFNIKCSLDPNLSFYGLQKRHRSDNQVNNRLSTVLRFGDIVEEKWQNVVVGDIIRMKSDQFVAVRIAHVYYKMIYLTRVTIFPPNNRLSVPTLHVYKAHSACRFIVIDTSLLAIDDFTKQGDSKHVKCISLCIYAVRIIRKIYYAFIIVTF